MHLITKPRSSKPRYSTGPVSDHRYRYSDFWKCRSCGQLSYTDQRPNKIYCSVKCRKRAYRWRKRRAEGGAPSTT